jgi:beta-aspartyl-peptidase (threonine type)
MSKSHDRAGRDHGFCGFLQGRLFQVRLHEPDTITLRRSEVDLENICLAVHGGAGTIASDAMDQEASAAHHEGLRAALRAGLAVLLGGGPAVDAVCAAVAVMEDDMLFNAGRGAVFTSAEQLEMDAAVMDGCDRRCGAVAGICGPQNPVFLARALMESGGPVFLTGRGAEDFARAAGLGFQPAGYFETARRRDALALELARRAAGAPDTRSDADRHGTVGAVARDAAGFLAAGTSTGGMTGKAPGRVGDTPVIGAGTLADDVCAVSCTGTGEVFIRFTAAAEIAARLRYGGQRLEQAAEEVVAELAAHGGDGGLIALARVGPPVLPFNSNGMYRGWVTAEGVMRTAIHRERFLQAVA